MSHTPHEITAEFPEKAAKIQALKQSSAHFARLAEEYHEINRQIHRMETNVEPVSDDTLEALKKQRLRLKDDIAGML